MESAGRAASSAQASEARSASASQNNILHLRW